MYIQAAEKESHILEQKKKFRQDKKAAQKAEKSEQRQPKQQQQKQQQQQQQKQQQQGSRQPKLSPPQIQELAQEVRPYKRKVNQIVLTFTNMIAISM